MSLTVRGKRIKEFKKDRALLQRAVKALIKLRKRVNLNPAQSDEVKFRIMELEQDIRLVNLSIDALLNGNNSIAPPSETQFIKMKEAVKELEQINLQDKKTKKAIATATKLASAIGNIN